MMETELSSFSVLPTINRRNGEFIATTGRLRSSGMSLGLWTPLLLLMTLFLRTGTGTPAIGPLFGKILISLIGMPPSIISLILLSAQLWIDFSFSPRRAPGNTLLPVLMILHWSSQIPAVDASLRSYFFSFPIVGRKNEKDFCMQMWREKDIIAFWGLSLEVEALLLFPSTLYYQIVSVSPMFYQRSSISIIWFHLRNFGFVTTEKSGLAPLFKPHAFCS